MTNTTNTQSSNSSVPTHVAYHVRDRDGAENFWNRVGCAWAHRDGKGFNLQLDCLPLDGRIVIRTASEKKS